ncbi:Tm-1-like ATP-binding domain-containing protein [Streptomyces sp. NPDC056716]|uniref:Tm-1-like ATP-binding domain-containing protein n=1 Tax=unclassified Streptomyces TaxID=2593676 RepID=UPI0036AAD148
MTRPSWPRPDAEVVAVLATLDTKGEEIEYLLGLLAARGLRGWVIDTGVLGEPSASAAVSRAQVAAAAGADLGTLRAGRDPATALDAMAEGARRVLRDLHTHGHLRAVVGVAGGKGAALFATASADLPLTSLKILVASARAEVLARIASTSTTVVLPTLVDLMGLNQLTRQALHRAAVLAGSGDPVSTSPVAPRTVAVTSFGVTTTAAMACVAALRKRGAETLVFPANGAGGRLLERLVDEGRIDGLIDLTTTELADELLGGAASAGPDRLRAAGRAGIPHWIAPGAVDMVNFGAPNTVPERFGDRIFYRHSPYTTLMRTSAEENRRIGETVAERLNAGHGPRRVCWTGGGFSDYDRPGGPFHDPAADLGWLRGVQSGLDPDIELVTLDEHINAPAVAAGAVEWMVSALAAATPGGPA